MNRRAKTITVIAMALGVAVLVLGAIALSDPVAEWWYLRQLNAGTPEEKRAAAKKLGALGSVRAIPALLEMAAEDFLGRTRITDRFGNLSPGGVFLIPADLDGDGFQDLVVGPSGDSTVFVTSTSRVSSGEGFQPLLQILAKRRPEALRAVRAALRHPRAEVRCVAALTLAHVEARDAALALQNALSRERTAWVRGVLEHALSRIRPGLDAGPNSPGAPPAGALKVKWDPPIPPILRGVDILWPNPLVAPPPAGSAVTPR